MSRSWIKMGVVALGLSVLVPALAWADASAPATELSEKGEKGKREKGKHEKAFPMEAAKFKEHVEKRIARVKERVTAGMEKHNVPEEKRREVIADLEKGAARIRTAADTAAKDGTVTAEEAKQVRGVAKEVRKEAREKYGHGKGKGHGKKGKGKGKDKADA